MDATLSFGAARAAGYDTAASESVSLIALIATPERYNNRRVMTSGYLKMEFEGNALYLGKEAHDAALLDQSIWVHATEQQERALERFSGHYVWIEGTYRGGPSGHLSTWPGSIDILRIGRNLTRREHRRLYSY